MTTLKLTKETDLLGRFIYKIIDQDNNVIGSYSTKPEADINFKTFKSQMENFGNLKKSEVIEEFTHTPKSEETWYDPKTAKMYDDFEKRKQQEFKEHCNNPNKEIQL